MGSNPILAAIDQARRCAPAGATVLLARLFLPCLYRQHIGPHWTRPDDAGTFAEVDGLERLELQVAEVGKGVQFQQLPLAFDGALVAAEGRHVLQPAPAGPAAPPGRSGSRHHRPAPPPDPAAPPRPDADGGPAGRASQAPRSARLGRPALATTPPGVPDHAAAISGDFEAA